MNKVQEFAVKNGVTNVFMYGACEERVFERQASECGYERKTTFFSDLSLAEWLGAASVRDTYNNVVKSWFNDKVYFTEFVMSLNWKIWEQHARGNDKWIDISFERQQVFVYQGKGKKDRVVPISEQQLKMLHCFKRRYPSDDFVFKSHGRGVTPQPIKPGYVRVIMKNALTKASLDHSITIHALRHSAASHLLENGESLLDVQKRLGHARLTTTMVYLHVADIEPMKHVRLIDTIFPPKSK